MTVNVRGRNIEIDDELAKKYALLGQVPIDEDFVLYELAVFFEDQDETILAQTMPEKELVDFIHKRIRVYLRVIGGMDE